MSETASSAKKLPFHLVLLLAICVTYFSVWLHEAGHWAVLEALQCGPTMGFAGIIQQWDTPPSSPHQWQRISYPNLGTAWLRLERLPQTSQQWTWMLLAGQLVAVLLLVVGILLYKTSSSHTLKAAGLMLVFVNGAMALPKIVSWLMGGIGDLYFVGFYSGINPAWVKGAFIVVLGSGLVWSLRQFPCPIRRRWMQALVLAYIIVVIPLQKANAVIRSAVEQELPWAAPLAGWSKPVWWVTAGFFVLMAGWYLFAENHFRNGRE